MSFSTNTINPKPCNYGCGTRIYWNTSENAYFEVFAKKKHICPNRSNYNNKKPSGIAASVPSTTTISKPPYYKKPFATGPKPKMDNSFEFLTGSPESIKIQYEYLSDLVRDSGGKIHGSQSHIIAPSNNIYLIVYYEVPAESQKREEVKRKFSNIKNQVFN